MSEESCKALYAYNGVGGEKIQTLQFEAGDIIKLLFTDDANWWEGEKNGTRGWFPATYVERIQEIDSTSNASEDWKEVTSENGEVYYVNVKTNATSWSIPSVSDSSEDHAMSKSLESSTNTSVDNVNGNSLYLPIPEPLTQQSVSQPGTPQWNREELLIQQSKSLPVTPDSSSPHKKSFKSASSTASIPQTQDSSKKQRVKMLNGISFPCEKEAKEQTLLQPGKFSYCDYFWNDKPDNHNFQSGFSVLYQKILKGKLMCKEVSDLFKAREAIEIQYSKSLASLANSVHAAQEEGTLGEALKQVKSATLLESKIHQEFANKLRNELSQHLLEQREKEKKDLKKLDASIAELRKQVYLKYQAADRAKQLLIDRNKDLGAKLNSAKYTKEDVDKARRKTTKTAEDLTNVVDLYNKQRQQWFEEMVTSSLVLERHEAARIERVKLILTQYCKYVEDANEKGIKNCKSLDEYIKKTDPEKDRELWVRKSATGKIRPVDLVI